MRYDPALIAEYDLTLAKGAGAASPQMRRYLMESLWGAHGGGERHVERLPKHYTKLNYAKDTWVRVVCIAGCSLYTTMDTPNVDGYPDFQQSRPFQTTILYTAGPPYEGIEEDKASILRGILDTAKRNPIFPQILRMHLRNGFFNYLEAEKSLHQQAEMAR